MISGYYLHYKIIDDKDMKNIIIWSQSTNILTGKVTVFN